MKRILITFYVLACVLSSFAQRIPDKDFINKISFQEAKNHENILKIGNSKLGDNYNLYYQRMLWNVNPSVNYISGSVTSYFTANSLMSQVLFELIDTLTVDSVKYHSNNIGFTHSANIITITLPAGIAAGVRDSICVYYHGAPPQGIGFGSFIQSTHNSVPIIWTLSEPFGAPDWWPCKNSLSDKIDSIDIYVTTPSANRVGSNGSLVSETLAGANKIFHWKHRYPIATYLIAIAVTNYSVYSDYATLQNGTLEILNYVFPEELTNAQQSTPDLIPVMQLFDSLFSDYPYMNEKYGHAQFGWGGGMEHQTMTFLVDFGYDLMAHELAHQWFGDKVTCKSWHDIWINESFATFLTGLTYYFLDNSSWYYWKRNNLEDILVETDGSVYCYDTTSVNRIFSGRLSYKKGAMVLNMLKLKIGDSALFTCMKNFMTDPQLIYGFAGTADFKNHAEASSGINLDGFFDDWIYNEGYPIYTINTTIKSDSTVTLVISQAQSHPSVSFFELPVPVRFSFGGIDTLIVFDNTFNNQSFDVQLNFKPNQVKFDPELELIAVLDTLILHNNNDVFSESELLIRPNPVNDILTVSLNKSKIDKIQILDLKGSIVKELTNINPESTVSLNLKSLLKGVYFINIISSDNICTRKIVKL